MQQIRINGFFYTHSFGPVPIGSAHLYCKNKLDQGQDVMTNHSYCNHFLAIFIGTNSGSALCDFVLERVSTVQLPSLDES